MNKIVYLTGPKNIPAEKHPEIQRALMFKIIEIIGDGVRHFCVSGNFDFDIMAALTVLNLKERFPCKSEGTISLH